MKTLMDRAFRQVLLLLALCFASDQVAAQSPGARERPLNAGLIGSVVTDANGRGIAGATVRLDYVAVDVSSCALRIYGPNRGTLQNLTANAKTGAS